MAEGKRKLLTALIVVAIVFTALVQSFIDPMAHRFNKSAGGGQNNELMVQLPGQFIIATLTGFKEVVAGALWIRADTFFHTGQFEAIVPIVRVVTWLDPHNIDVFTTGAWHLDYNFVDKNELSDKRYIPASVALLKEGIKNNPNTWDLYFELAWTHYNKKLTDYDNGQKYMEMAVQHEGRDANGGPTPRPAFVDRMLAHQYEKTGQFDKAIKQWQVARARAEKMSKSKTDTMTDETAITVCDRNLALLYLRLGFRYGNMEYYKKGVEMMQQIAAKNGTDAAAIAAAKGAAADYAMRVATNNPPKDAMKPLDLGFNVTFEKIKPRVFRVFGTVNLLPTSEFKGLAVESITNTYANYLKTPADKRAEWFSGARVNWKLTDADYKPEEVKTFTWKIDRSKMVVWDSLPIIDGKFGMGRSDVIDLSDNLAFYPFKADKYKLTVWLTPREPNCDDTIQDRVGWKGEAFTDKKYLDTKMLPGYKCVKWETILDRKDLI